MRKNVTVVSTPLVQDALSHLRDSSSSVATFRKYSDVICYELLSHCLPDALLESREIHTPVATTTGQFLSGNVVFIAILRAGLAMLPAALNILPDVKVGFIGLARNEVTANAEEYYYKFPEITSDTTVIIGDPMLATGGSLIHAISRVEKLHPKAIYSVGVVAAPEGITAVQDAYTEVSLITAVIDEKLNDAKYIVPGLGDYGDRYFGT